MKEDCIFLKVVYWPFKCIHSPYNEKYELVGVMVSFTSFFKLRKTETDKILAL